MSGLLAGATVGAICGVIVSAAMRKDPYSLPRPVTEADVERLAEALYVVDMAVFEYSPEDTAPFRRAEDRETYLRHARVCLGFLTATDSSERN